MPTTRIERLMATPASQIPPTSAEIVRAEKPHPATPVRSDTPAAGSARPACPRGRDGASTMVVVLTAGSGVIGDSEENVLNSTCHDGAMTPTTGVTTAQ